MDIKINKLGQSEIEITGSLPAADFMNYRAQALKKMSENMDLPGFRKGHVPEEVVLKNVPEMAVLEEMAQSALNKAYPQILKDYKIDAIGPPEISITKLAKDNPLEFKIKTATVPEVILPDYKAIASKPRSDLENSKRSDLEVTDEEVEKTVQEILKMRAKDEKVPEFNDEFVKSLGGFTDTADFKTKLKENIKVEKENRAHEKKRLAIMESIIDGSKIELPKMLVNLELDKIIYRLQGDVAQTGIKFEDYLKSLKKTEADIRAELEKDAEKRAKLGLILDKIAEVENLRPEAKDIEHELSHLLEQYKDADKDRARAYVENILTNEKVFQFLETL